MKTQIILSFFLAIALTLTNSNIALSESDNTSSTVCNENGSEYKCPD